MNRIVVQCVCCFLTLTAVFACNFRKSQPADESNDYVVTDTLTEPLSENPLAENHVSQDSALDLQTDLDSTDAPLVERLGDYIYISKPQMRLYVLNKHDSVLFSCGIACGIKRGNKQEVGDYRTPEGVFKIVGIYESTDWVHKTRDWRMVKGCYGPYYLSLRTPQFTGIGIHGTNAPRSIGKRASEGCIRVKTENIIFIKENYAYGGMQVIVSGENERLPFMIGPTNRDVKPTKPDTLHTLDSVATESKSAVLHPHATDKQGTDILRQPVTHQNEPEATSAESESGEAYFE